MTGCNNVGLTLFTPALFTTIKANVKACIFTKDENVSRTFDLCQYTCFCVYISDATNILELLAAVTKIIDEVLKVKSSVTAYFLQKKEKKMYKVDLSLISAVPVYLLRFSSQTVICSSKNEYSYNSI